MLYIEFTPNSLLYGESYFWLAISVFAPAHLAPNFRTTQSAHIVSKLPGSATLMHWHTRISESPLAKSLLVQTFLLFQMLYLVTFVVVGHTLQDSLLARFGIRARPETLTYKILVQTPTIFRLGLLTIAFNNLQDPNYNMWRLHDKCVAFAVDVQQQARVARWCLVSVVPDALANVIETLFIVHYMATTEPYGGSWWTRNARFWLAHVVLSGLLSIAVRYKPVLNATYAAVCVTRHLETLQAQLAATGAAAAVGRHSQCRLLSTSARHPTRILKKNGPATETTTKTATISNLFELERHLTEVQLFVGDLDRESPATVLTLTIINSMTFFYAYFFTACYRADAAYIACSLLVCIARSLPLIMMFLAGGWLEQACRRLSDQLETFYYSEKSHTLIYKQMASSHLSLARVFRALRRTRLTCNGLMRVNARTLRRCAIYICTVILIVVQYDSLVVVGVGNSSGDSTLTRSRLNEVRGGDLLSA